MRVLVAPNAFKGSLSPAAAAHSLSAGLRRSLEDVDVAEFPISDGGQGFVDAVVTAKNGEFVEVEVEGPLGDHVRARFGLIGAGRTAVVEMASASGITLIPAEKRDPLKASTYGTGQIIRAALERGCDKLIVGIGGSATNDGGAGMAQALGARLLDPDGRDLGRGGGELARLESIDATGVDERLRMVDVIVACDVTNPLCGETGASAVYGPQKGATPEMVRILDRNLFRFAQVMKRDLGADVLSIPGSGAAGGLGGGLLAFAGARLMPGFEIVSGILGLEAAVRACDLVVTGEGRLDLQTLSGKGPLGVARLARGSGVPVVAVAGQVEDGAWDAMNEEFDAVVVASGGPSTEQATMAAAGTLLERAGLMIGRMISVGRVLERRDTP
ncbi:MAG: glycerate kinase [Firmicutes bacterium]|nr:glycerate kinase [Bacillota bacterium]